MSSPDRTAAAIRTEGGLFLEPLVRRFLAHIDAGDLTVELPSGARLARKGASPGPHAFLAIHRWRAIWRLILLGDVGFAESYISGDWSSRDLPTFIELAARNVEPLEAKIDGSFADRLIARLRHLAHANTRTGSRKNIAFHYDLGNAFYQCWLDPSMTYSSALYAGPFDTLEDAQARKIRRIAELLDIDGGSEVLEIGCGWGALAISLAQLCRSVKGVTLSAEQLLMRKAASARTVSRRRSRLSSATTVILSAPSTASCRSRWSRPSGRRSGLTIFRRSTIARAQAEPWCCRPSRLRSAASNPTASRQISSNATSFQAACSRPEALFCGRPRKLGFHFSFSESFGESYARTLSEWRAAFPGFAQIDRGMGFSEEFQRMWDYYLSYSEGGFRAGIVDVGFYGFRRAAA